MDFETLKGYEGKKGTIQIDETGENVEELEGATLVGVTQAAVIVHNKAGGSRLLRHDQVLGFEPDPEKKKAFKPKRLDPIDVEDAEKLRTHLLDRHGVLVSDVEELDASALRSLHDRLHNAGVLGHVHETKEASKNRSRAEDAAKEAEASAA